jgi:hypothetical protein
MGTGSHGRTPKLVVQIGFEETLVNKNNQKQTENQENRGTHPV